jgi:hypothetical protein
MIKEIKIGDIVIILLLITSSIYFLITGFTSIGNADTVEIISNNKVYKYNLNENQKIRIEGALGEVIIEVKDKKIRLIEDKSPRKLGVKMGWVGTPGIPIICLPCKVSATIVSSETDNTYHQFDAYSE